MITNGHLTIGPVQWVLQVPEGGKVRYSDPAYAGFWTEATQPSRFNPLGILPISIRREARAVPLGDPVYRGGKNWALWKAGEDRIICSGFHAQPAPRFYCQLSREKASACLFLDPAREQEAPDRYEAPLRYPLDQILSWGLLAQCGGLILHAAVAVKNGVGWVFAGRSGAGKSTLAELCHRAGWRILNDDRVIIFQRGETWRVAGTPWHGSGRFAEADEVPLGGVLMIQKATREQIERMPAQDIRFALLDVAAIPWFDREWSHGALDAADRLVETAPVFQFSFSRSSSVVHVLENFCNQSGGGQV